MTHLLDNPGMMEAKIMMPYKTSTPMKPIFSKAADLSSLAETGAGVEDSGYLSCLADQSQTNTSALKSDSSYCKDGRKNLSLFESMLQSRNHSINLEQLVEKVNLRKEKKNELFYNVSTSGRQRSYSASEISSGRGEEGGAEPGLLHLVQHLLLLRAQRVQQSHPGPGLTHGLLRQDEAPPNPAQSAALQVLV